MGNSEPIDSGLYSINGNKGIYDCFFIDHKGYGYKFKINCEQVSFPKGIVPKGGNVNILETCDKNEGKKLKPFNNLFKTLSNYSPDIKNKASKKRVNKDKDEEYKLSREELKELDKPDNNFMKRNKKQRRKYINALEYKPTLEELQGLKNNLNNIF